MEHLSVPGGEMPLERAHSFLVHPAKNEPEKPEIVGTEIPRRGSLFGMLTGVFDRAPHECKIDIVFQPGPAGEQQNECRDLVVAYVLHSTIANGRLLASRLQSVTTRRSGLGLLFLMKGDVDDEQRLVISRFPADQGVIAEEEEEHLSVQFVERIFMKSAKSYKSALYSSDSPERGFWEGRAVDRQVKGPRELPDYWIQEFLSSELRTTAAAGTKRFAVALRTATHNVGELAVKQELIAAASLLRGQQGRRGSARQIVEQLGLSPVATDAVRSAFPRADLMNEVFDFDREEFQAHAAYRAVGLDNGAMLIAEDTRFDQIFEREYIEDDHVRFTTQGRVLEEELRKEK
jgi:hypothetical protein